MFGSAAAGKTQLVADHARAKRAAGWRSVGWVSAGEAATLRDGLAAVADAAGLAAGSTGGDDPGDPGELVRDWIEADGNRCLLMFGLDDSAGAEAVAAELGPRSRSRA
jgi:hypothetical protein